MSETPWERRKRLVLAMWPHIEGKGFRRPEEQFDGLLAALEPPVAEMVRLGVEEVRDGYAFEVFTAHDGERAIRTVKATGYRPRSEP